MNQALKRAIHGEPVWNPDACKCFVIFLQQGNGFKTFCFKRPWWFLKFSVS